MHRHSVKNGYRRQVFNKQNGICAMCGKRIYFYDFTVDHIIPVSKGGKNTLDNMEAMCYTCNHMKADILKTDFLEHISKIYKHNFN
jgi:5-methylcytosine-specific restriction endonuclease McrA